MSAGEIFYYRFDDRAQSTGYFDVWGDYVAGTSYMMVEVRQFLVTKKTPKGAWVLLPDLHGRMGPRLILDHWHKKEANPTLEGARNDFIKRKKRLIAIQSRRILQAQESIALAEAKLEGKGLYQRPLNFGQKGEKF